MSINNLELFDGILWITKRNKKTIWFWESSKLEYVKKYSDHRTIRSYINEKKKKHTNQILNVVPILHSEKKVRN